jgi:hypothetical protein
MKVSKDEVFKALATERGYQLLRWGVKQPDGSLKENEHSVCDFIVYMQDYLTLAISEATQHSGDKYSLEQLRKVATLLVACFEQHGIELRPSGPVINGHDGQTYQ